MSRHKLSLTLLLEQQFSKEGSAYFSFFLKSGFSLRSANLNLATQTYVLFAASFLECDAYKDIIVYVLRCR